MTTQLMVDITRDPHLRRLYNISRQVEIPQFVKGAAAQVDEEVIARLAPAAFADSTSRTFPCHTKVATAISYLFYRDQAEAIPSEQQKVLDERFDRFGDFWGIRGDLRILRDQMNKQSLQKQASAADDDYALVVQYEGAPVRELPIRDAGEIAASAHMLRSNTGRYPLDWRVKAARRILKQADRLGASLDFDDHAYLHCAAMIEPASPHEIADGLSKRASLLGGEFAAEGGKLLDAAIALRGRGEPLTCKQAADLAASLDDTDQSMGLADRYVETGLFSPEQTCFGYRSKMAAALLGELVRTTTGAAYKKSDLASLSPDVYAAVDEDLADEISDGMTVDPSKVAEVLPTLPLDSARRLHTVLEAAGVQKFAFVTYKGRGVQEMTHEDWMGAMDEAGFELDKRDFSASFKLKSSTPRKLDQPLLTE